MKKKYRFLKMILLSFGLWIIWCCGAMAAEEELDGFGTVGNDPNNVWQSKDCLAFDGEYIYYSTDNLIKRCRRDGTEAVCIGNGSGFLNIYDGYLYYAETESEYARIKRINLDSLETELVYELAGNKYEHINFEFMLVANGHVLYGVTNLMSGYSRIGAVDLENLYSYTLFNANDGGYLDMNISVTRDSVYAFVESEDAFSSDERQVWKVDFTDIRNGAWLSMVADTSDYVLTPAMILLEDGAYRYAYDSLFEKNLYYYKVKYETINEEECIWGAISEEGRTGVDLLQIPEEETWRVLYNNVWFLIGDTMFIAEWLDKSVEIFRYEDFNFNKSQCVGSVEIPDYYTLLGGRNEDCIYLVETTQGKENLICIDEDGTLTRSQIVLAEKQNGKADAKELTDHYETEYEETFSESSGNAAAGEKSEVTSQAANKSGIVTPPTIDVSYLIESSSDAYLTDADLAGLDYSTLVYARYEILARKNMRFEDEAVKDYFEQKDWYVGFIDEAEFSVEMLNEYERLNLELLDKAIESVQTETETVQTEAANFQIVEIIEETEKEKETEAQYASEYIFEEADSRVLTDSEINALSLQEVCYAKNELYARHGRKFLSGELQAYFNSKSWYQGTVEPADFSVSVFNEYEMRNVELLAAREEVLQSGGYVLDQPGYDIHEIAEPNEPYYNEKGEMAH